MDMNWGKGWFDVLVDVAKGILHPYSSDVTAAEVHKEFGGKNYYTSQTGLTGAGWMPKRMEVRLANTYRADTHHLDFGGQQYRDRKTFGDLRVFIPISYRGNTIATKEWPIVIPGPEDNMLYVVRPEGLGEFLRGDFAKGVEKRTITVRYIPNPESDPQEFEVRLVEPRSGYHRQEGKLSFLGSNLAKVVEAFYHDRIKFDSGYRWEAGESNHLYGEDAVPQSINPFWSQLGLQLDKRGNAYKFRNGIARSRHSVTDLTATAEALQAVAPKNVKVLTPSFYIQERDGGFVGVGLFSFEGSSESYDFEETLGENEVARAFGGEFSEILQRLETGARQKFEGDQQRAEAAAREKVSLEEFLQRAVTEHGEVQVTMADSIAAGNCQVGTREFRDRSFPGRESVTVKELVPYARRGVYGVRRVLEHKLGFSVRPGVPTLPPPAAARSAWLQEAEQDAEYAVQLEGAAQRIMDEALREQGEES